MRILIPCKTKKNLPIHSIFRPPSSAVAGGKTKRQVKMVNSTHQSSSSAQQDSFILGIQDESLRCPFCYHYFQLNYLFQHLVRSHSRETRLAVCPICSESVAVRNIETHFRGNHGNLFDRLRRRRFQMAIPTLRRHHTASSMVGSSSGSTDSNCDFLQLVSSAEQRRRKLRLDSLDAMNSFQSIPPTDDQNNNDTTNLIPPPTRPDDSSLTIEQREERRRHAVFFQDLIASTLIDD